MSIRSLFEWWHARSVGTEALTEYHVGKHREVARQLIDKMHAQGPLLGLHRIVHTFNDYHVSNRQPVGTWRVVVERIEAPPAGVVALFRRTTNK